MSEPCPFCDASLDAKDDVLRHVAEDHLGGGLMETEKLDVYLGTVLNDRTVIDDVRGQVVAWLESLSKDLLPSEREQAERSDAMTEALVVADLAQNLIDGQL
jgi:hypothetical protein